MSENDSSPSGVDCTERALTTPAAKDSDNMADSEHTSKSPAFQFYPNDFLSDRNVVVMSMQERGVYITLICHAWQSPLPADVVQLAKFCGVPLTAFRKFWPALAVCFREQDGYLVHPRLERERLKQVEYRRRQSDRGKASGVSRRKHEPDANAGSVPVQPKPNAGSITVQPNTNRPVELLSSSSLISSSDFSQKKEHTPAVPPDIGKRSGAFIQWYQDKHQELIGGYVGNPNNDDAASLNLCRKFNDQELRDAALVWFGMQDSFTAKGNRTIPKFASRITECIQIARRVSA